MAKNLAMKSTGPVYVYDVNQAAIQRVTNEFPNLKLATDPVELAEKSSTIITMLPEGQHVEHVYDEILSTIEQDDFLIDSSTIDTSAAQSLAKKVQDKKALAFDAPVSGGTVGAANGTLTFMVGAPSIDAFERIKPVLSLMGKNTIYCGDNGAGQVAKVCNNMLLAVHMIGVSEAMKLGAQLGMDPKLLASVINVSTGKCWSSEVSNPYPGVIPTAPASREYQGGFSNKLMAKDLRAAMKAAQSCDFTPVFGTKASEIYQQLATSKEFDTLDFSSVFKWMSSNK
ncbi:3-hydroxyisobutyrate dehydrogenase [Gilbertella persicaria]|uniref:3-hydroxyisobutyrate dehydrogenase n=1 Tax=Gilbertella persicaria TaxID=101096 RepID=UPI002220F5CE|nr:3-hydroxyisobutyrate dehydrogenase [Gilbertella persicaria]KAI8091099.1 3-hydroxyisobutyrate dehydrogenase [Gilbertella persicaria]